MITEKDLNCKAIKHSIYGNIIYGSISKIVVGADGIPVFMFKHKDGMKATYLCADYTAVNDVDIPFCGESLNNTQSFADSLNTPTYTPNDNLKIV